MINSQIPKKKKEQEKVATHVHKSMSHRTNNSNTLELLFVQRKDSIVLKKDNALTVESPRQCHRFIRVDDFLPLVLRCCLVRVIEKPHDELSPEDARDSSVQNINFQRSIRKKSRNSAVVTVETVSRSSHECL